MKIDITAAQLKAIKDMADDLDSSLGNFDEEPARIAVHQVKMVDAMLKRNNLPDRDFKVIYDRC